MISSQGGPAATMRTMSHVHADGKLPSKSELRPDAPQGDETLAGKVNEMLLDAVSSRA